ncbi:TetR/AcrR family transcriptional regulator [Sphingomicrobium sp. XHP0239]|uniref:TetR/AcrR family transcriptional regulator n=1 Tax=Sphingomicrobium maritimum TaxID=3133972 RepID=UPI0031CCC2FE
MSNPPAEKKLRPSSEAKRDAILAAASRAFFDEGFAAASIEAIAADAGVSKVTVYNHFGDKEGLFAAAVQAECAGMQGMIRLESDAPRKPIREHLTMLGTAFHRFLSQSQIVRFDRRIAAEADRDPAVGAAFLDAGPRPMCDHLAGVIAAAHDAGEIEVADPQLAAEQFVSMCKGFGEMERRYGAATDPMRDQERIEGAVAVFMRAYGTAAR